MSTTALIAEFLVAGFIVLATIFFFILTILDIRNFNFLSQIKDFSSVVVILVLILSYLFGAVLHRITAPGYKIGRKLLRVLSRIKLLNFLFKLVKKWLENAWYEKFYFVLEHGSNNLIERIEYMQSLTRLFKNVAIATLLFGIIFTIWLMRAFGDWKVGFTAMFISFLVVLCSTIAAYAQDDSLNIEVEIAYEIIQTRISREQQN